MSAAANGAEIAPPWRLAVFVLATAAGVLGLRVAHMLLADWIPVAARPASFMWVLAGGLLIGHTWTFRAVEPRRWTYVGLGRDAFRASALGLGGALGAAAIALPVGLLLAVGWLRFTPAAPGSNATAAVAAVALLLPASLWEELFVRGFAFAILRERWGTTRALMATSFTFGALHFLNDGATVLSVAVVMLAGVFLGLILVRTASLYAAWAAHLSWNLVLVAVLHATVSGIDMAAPVYRLIDAGPDWATGGAWGPEGGLFAAAGLAVATLILVRRPARRPEHAHE